MDVKQNNGGEMKQLGEINGCHLFASLKRADTYNVIDEIGKILQCDYSYVGINSLTDIRINGRQDIVDLLGDRIDFKTHNLIIVKKDLTEAE